MTKSGTIHCGIGGWTFDPWDDSFYPSDLPKKRQLEYASRQLTAVEVNGTYYSSQKPATFAKWASEVPEDFVFSLKASRYCTNRKILAEAGPSIEKFVNQGIEELGPHLGPILWQFMGTKKFDPADFESFLKLLPNSVDGIKLRTQGCEPAHLPHNSDRIDCCADQCYRKLHDIGIDHGAQPPGRRVQRRHGQDGEERQEVAGAALGPLRRIRAGRERDPQSLDEPYNWRKQRGWQPVSPV